MILYAISLLSFIYNFAHSYQYCEIMTYFFKQEIFSCTMSYADINSGLIISYIISQAVQLRNVVGIVSTRTFVVCLWRFFQPEDEMQLAIRSTQHAIYRAKREILSICTIYISPLAFSFLLRTLSQELLLPSIYIILTSWRVQVIDTMRLWNVICLTSTTYTLFIKVSTVSFFRVNSAYSRNSLEYTTPRWHRPELLLSVNPIIP